MESFSAKNCLECGKPLKGRKDKKFCDPDCKAMYHNRNKTLGEEMISHFNSVLRHNRRILKTLCPEGKSTVRREILEQMGYKFKHFTDVFRTSSGVYYLCYDYGWMPIKEGSKEKAVIVQRQEYFDQSSFDPWSLV